MKKIILIVSLVLLASCSQQNTSEPEEQIIEDEVNEIIEEVKVIKTPPIITFNDDVLETVWNKPIDLLYGVSAVDYEGNFLEVVVDGYYDFNGIGEYQLYYVATDKNGAKDIEEFTLIVGEPEIVCPDDPDNGTAADNPYLPCDYVFEEDLKVYNEHTIKDFPATVEGREQCLLEASTYDKDKYIADCWSLINNVRGANKIGLWLEERVDQ